MVLQLQISVTSQSEQWTQACHVRMEVKNNINCWILEVEVVLFMYSRLSIITTGLVFTNILRIFLFLEFSNNIVESVNL